MPRGDSSFPSKRSAEQGGRGERRGGRPKRRSRSRPSATGVALRTQQFKQTLALYDMLRPAGWDVERWRSYNRLPPLVALPLDTERPKYIYTPMSHSPPPFADPGGDDPELCYREQLEREGVATPMGCLEVRLTHRYRVGVYLPERVYMRFRPFPAHISSVVGDGCVVRMVYGIAEVFIGADTYESVCMAYRLVVLCREWIQSCECTGTALVYPALDTTTKRTGISSLDMLGYMPTSARHYGTACLPDELMDLYLPCSGVDCVERYVIDVTLPPELEYQRLVLPHGYLDTIVDTSWRLVRKAIDESIEDIGRVNRDERLEVEVADNSDNGSLQIWSCRPSQAERLADSVSWTVLPMVEALKGLVRNDFRLLLDPPGATPTQQGDSVLRCNAQSATATNRCTSETMIGCLVPLQYSAVPPLRIVAQSTFCVFLRLDSSVVGNLKEWCLFIARLVGNGCNIKRKGSSLVIIANAKETVHLAYLKMHLVISSIVLHLQDMSEPPVSGVSPVPALPETPKETVSAITQLMTRTDLKTVDLTAFQPLHFTDLVDTGSETVYYELTRHTTRLPVPRYLPATGQYSASTLANHISDSRQRLFVSVVEGTTSVEFVISGLSEGVVQAGRERLVSLLQRVTLEYGAQTRLKASQEGAKTAPRGEQPASTRTVASPVRSLATIRMESLRRQKEREKQKLQLASSHSVEPAPVLPSSAGVSVSTAVPSDTSTTSVGDAQFVIPEADDRDPPMPISQDSGGVGGGDSVSPTHQSEPMQSDSALELGEDADMGSLPRPVLLATTPVVPIHRETHHDMDIDNPHIRVSDLGCNLKAVPMADPATLDESGSDSEGESTVKSEEESSASNEASESSDTHSDDADIGRVEESPGSEGSDSDICFPSSDESSSGDPSCESGEVAEAVNLLAEEDPGSDSERDLDTTVSTHEDDTPQVEESVSQVTDPSHSVKEEEGTMGVTLTERTSTTASDTCVPDSVCPQSCESVHTYIQEAVKLELFERIKQETGPLQSVGGTATSEPVLTDTSAASPMQVTDVVPERVSSSNPLDTRASASITTSRCRHKCMDHMPALARVVLETAAETLRQGIECSSRESAPDVLCDFIAGWFLDPLDPLVKRHCCDECICSLLHCTKADIERAVISKEETCEAW
ncbi:hypothetical protein KIPB_002262 [Kipferlia bialata]|uniref:Uncharacterized protein n=1 Tax=Kipferlia bialata TaxID=797122 RepID=A0A9K3CS64_9EUKA|nr:hypothetical protein KIPB_002262 [Kipferlia bialata]|eukprot:g2262.t1